MSPEAQRIAIAEACGLKLHTERVEHTDGYQWVEVRQFWVCPKGRRVAVPDYLNDLNAMHEAEKLLTGDQFYKYSCHIYTAACETQKKTGEWRFIGATAAQRAEAFLRTIGAWQDSQQGGAK